MLFPILFSLCVFLMKLGSLVTICSISIHFIFIIMISFDKGVLDMKFRWYWNFFNKAFFVVFIFKQIVSFVALFDSAKDIINFDEEERANAAKKD